MGYPNLEICGFSYSCRTLVNVPRSARVICSIRCRVVPSAFEPFSTYQNCEDKRHRGNLLSGYRYVVKNPQQCGFFIAVIGSLILMRIESPLLNYPKHIAHILDHDPGDVGDGVDVVLGVVGEAGAGHEVEVLEDGAEAFADAVVEFA